MQTVDTLIDLTNYPLLLSVAQVAEIVGCSVPAVRMRLRRQELPVIRVGHSVRVPREALRHYLAARLIPAREQP
jgi:excisionase family DNA binding protein